MSWAMVASGAMPKPNNNAVRIVGPSEGYITPRSTAKARKAAAKALKKDSASQQEALPQRHSGSGAPSSTENTFETSRLESTEASSTSLPSQQGTQGYDVYAAPFVPYEWRTVNMEKPVRIIPTINIHNFDHFVYSSTFAGTDFVRELPPPAPTKGQYTSNLAGPTAELYLPYFTNLCRLERAGLKQENEGHTLYKQLLYKRNTTMDDHLWELSVPGLRENNPFLQMGDVLQLRQLWIDSNMHVMQVPTWGKDTVASRAPILQYKCWTQVQYDARVFSVNRAKEVVYLKAEGLMPLQTDYHTVPMMVNVCFPLKHDSLGRQQRALTNINSELRKTSEKAGVASFGHSLELKDELVTALSNNNWIRRILFPEENDGVSQTQLREIPNRALFDHAINYEQVRAVNSVCANDYGTLPYLISGPPGTGKTKTLVETAMQLLHTTKVAHILICAPSESAADTIAIRLKQRLSNTQLFRLNHMGRPDNEMSQELIPYCHMVNGTFTVPPFRKLMAYNIVVTSCQDAGILMDARLTNNDLWEIERNTFAAFHPEDNLPVPNLHWGALLIDEAAQATEMDLLCAISVACPPSTYPPTSPQPLFVMAGDENQLGPRTASRDPLYSQSLFARLFSRPLYASHPLSRNNTKPSSSPPVLKKYMLPITFPPFANLIRNYRSHPAILSIPSSLFYADTLIPEATTPSTPLQHCALWRGRKWPVLFLPHTGADELERDGGGWYNYSEAQRACALAQTLVDEAEVAQNDICIMSSFAAQVKLLRSLIRGSSFGGGAGLWGVNIGPLEAFQGLESRVVILCTTRSRARFLVDDERLGRGIVGQKRKMNVALTRAREGLFVLGNPEILSSDANWSEWMAFCARNGLVADDAQMSKEGKLGVLERALVVKESNGSAAKEKGKGKMLGGAATTLDMSRDYELWVESLREALDEENEGANGEEGEDDAGEEDGTGDEDEGVALGESDQDDSR
jgi:helicase MOV-10